MENLQELATLIGQRNAIDRAIAAIVGRPGHAGHLAEYVASAIFDIALNTNARQKATDGVFRAGPLAGRTVNVKYTARHKGILNMSPSPDPTHHPDLYLLLGGPRSSPESSAKKQAPLCIDSVYLFDAPSLLQVLSLIGLKPGVARSIPHRFWDAAMVYPEARHPELAVTPEQRTGLVLFACQPPLAVAHRLAPHGSLPVAGTCAPPPTSPLPVRILTPPRRT